MSKDATKRDYEIGYLVSPTVPEDDMEEVVGELTNAITSAGGEVHASEDPEMRELAYEMEVQFDGEKRLFSRGQFGWVQFSLNASSIDDIDEVFDNHEDVIRYLLIKIDPAAIGGREESASEDDTEEAAV